MELIAAGCYVEYVQTEIKEGGSEDFSSEFVVKVNQRNDNDRQDRSWF